MAWHQNSKRQFIRSLAFITVFALSALGQQRLFVVGGGTRPEAGMRQFVEWSGGARAKILVVTWATASPDESFESAKKGFTAVNAGAVEHAATRPLDGDKRGQFISQLKTATAVFFSGGDQNRIMDVLKDDELVKLLRAKYAAGAPFGGTSAGAAVLSDPMMTGEADLKILDGTKVGVRPGLGLISNVMFDQHFLVRQRHNRLFGFLIQNPKYLGVGIDEDTAVLIEDNRRLRVVGATQVMFVHSSKNSGNPFLVSFLKSGERFDLSKRKQIKP